MSSLYRSTPLDDVAQLHEIYGAEDSSKIPFLQHLNKACSIVGEFIESSAYNNHGAVLSVEGKWGSGKTTLVELLCKEIEKDNVAIVKYDSLYYGNVSEATDIFIKDIFELVKDRFGVKLKDGSEIAKNITPKFELSTGLPKLSFGYESSRAPTEVIKRKLQAKLSGLSGKVIVVIDDLDRVPADDAVHFLRVVRVLRELPNFLIVLPVDRRALEDLLSSQGIASPRSYLQKIIDETVDINPELGSSKDLFHKLLKNKYPGIKDNEEFCNLVWDLYLWEISLNIIRKYEVQDQQRLALSTGPTDGTWQLLQPANNSRGENLVKKFFEQTNRSYGAESGYVVRVNDHARQGPDRKDIFRPYSVVFSGMTFTELMYGRYTPNLNVNEEDFSNGDLMLNFRWWNDKESIIPKAPGANPAENEIKVDIPVDEQQAQEYNEYINEHAHYLWDTVRALASAFLPELAIQYLAPRTLNKIVSDLDIDPQLFIDAKRVEDYAEYQRSMRRTVDRDIVFNT